LRLLIIPHSFHCHSEERKSISSLANTVSKPKVCEPRLAFARHRRACIYGYRFLIRCLAFSMLVGPSKNIKFIFFIYTISPFLPLNYKINKFSSQSLLLLFIFSPFSKPLPMPAMTEGMRLPRLSFGKPRNDRPWSSSFCHCEPECVSIQAWQSLFFPKDEIATASLPGSLAMTGKEEIAMPPLREPRNYKNFLLSQISF